MSLFILIMFCIIYFPEQDYLSPSTKLMDLLRAFKSSDITLEARFNLDIKVLVDEVAALVRRTGLMRRANRRNFAINNRKTRRRSCMIVVTDIGVLLYPKLSKLTRNNIEW